MAGLFSEYRAEHHPDQNVRLRLATEYVSGEIDESDACKILGRRDRVFRLEMESSTLAGILIEPLTQACPEKKFILTIRDVYSWCDSWLDHNINQPPLADSPWTILDRVRLRVNDFEPTEFDAPLAALGFPPLPCFFQMWAGHNERVLGVVSPNRLLIVPTHEITSMLPKIAAWANVPVDKLRADRAWLHAAPRKHHVLATLDPSYVQETADRYCGHLMRSFFPNVPAPTVA